MEHFHHCPNCNRFHEMKEIVVLDIKGYLCTENASTKQVNESIEAIHQFNEQMKYND
ncbi:MAG: hypothetical protein ACQEWV_06660 [Bacillota bacterium]